MMQTKNSFARLLGAQLRALFNSSGFQFAWLLMLFISLSGMAKMYILNFDSAVVWQSGIDDQFLFGDHPAARDAFFFFMPVACALAFAGSTLQEKASGLLPALLVRQSKAQYYFAKMLTCMIAAVLVVAVPLLINLALNAIVFPTSFENVIWPDGNIASGRMFFQSDWEIWKYLPLKSLYLKNIYLYLLAHIGMAGLYAAVGAAFAYAASYFFKYPVLTLLPFFLLQQLLAVLSSPVAQTWNVRVDVTDYLRTTFGTPRLWLPVFFIVVACIALLTVLLVPHGLKKLRNVY